MFAIVADSGCGISDEFRKRDSFYMIGIKVFLNSVEYEDGKLDKDEFYERVLAGEEVRTSHPSPADFEKLYRNLFDKGYDEILSFHISSKVSGTFNAARLAANEVNPSRIHVVDSLNISVGAYLMLRRMVELADEGTPLSEVIKRRDYFRENTLVLFTVENLNFLIKNGRIGKAAGLVGSILKLSPILTVKDGEAGTFSVVRGRKKLLPKMAEACHRFLENRKDVRMIFGYSSQSTLEQMKELQRVVAEKLENFEKIPREVLKLWPTIPSHTGPKTFGLGCYGEK